jgi:ribonucleotide reductase alpha subunit
MYVVKRSGKRQDVHFDKITTRIQQLCLGLNPDYVDPVKVAQRVCAGVYGGVTTVELDQLAAETAFYLSSQHADYGVLAARIAVSNLHKSTRKVFSEVMGELRNYVNPRNRKPSPLIHEGCWAFIQKHKDRLDNVIIHKRDYEYDYFGFKTLERSYLLKINGQIVERPQHMLLRVACGIHFADDDIDGAIETYELMSQKWYTHASPTLFNSGTPKPQMASCFLLTVTGDGDSIEAIYDTLKHCALISKGAGGIGLSVSSIRATGSYIAGTNGTSNGLVPMLRVFNNTARYVDQGGGKRKGSFAIYLEPWHYDIFQFLELKKNQGSEELRARDLFLALWIPDLFMKRVEANEQWSLFCPNEAPGMMDVHGQQFEELYERYEREGRARKVVPARTVWQAIVERQTENGTPYMLYKDACNAKSNQKNLGTIRSSNLCVVPETLILTKEGQKPIGSLKDQKVTIWNGVEWSDVTVKQTGANSELVRVSLSDGGYIDCTPEHKFLIGRTIDTAVRFHAKELRPGMALPAWTHPQGNRNVDRVHIASVTPLERRSDVFCFTEPKLHTGIFNGAITSQCTEIVQFTSSEEIAVCNLASIALSRFVAPKAGDDSKQLEFDHQKLFEVTKKVVRNLNKVIDQNYYPIPAARLSNLLHRPIGIGVQGLADAFALLRIPYTSAEGKKLNSEIFETMYFAALTASNELAEKYGPYESYSAKSSGGKYKDCPVAQGILQFDMWGVKPSPRWDWSALRAKIAQHGVRNSLLLAPMPTASTSQILGNNESFEPFTSNLYSRRTLAGEFVMVNKHLLTDLLKLKLWTDPIKAQIIAQNGSIQNIPEIPEEIRELYKTVREMSGKDLIDMAAARGAFIDQSQSFNVHMSDITVGKLTSMHFYAWKMGLKTGLYYLHNESAADPQKHTISHAVAKAAKTASVSKPEKEVPTFFEAAPLAEMPSSPIPGSPTAVEQDRSPSPSPTSPSSLKRAASATDLKVSTGNVLRLKVILPPPAASATAVPASSAKRSCPLRKPKVVAKSTTGDDEDDTCLSCGS